MTRTKRVSSLKMSLLIFSVVMLGIITQTNFTVAGQSDTAKIKGKVTDESGFTVGEPVQFEIEINRASDAACDDGAWTLEFGDGRSSTGSNSATRTHTYLRAGAYNAVLSYTYFENVGSAAPDCRAQSAGDSVAVVINEPEMPDSTTPDEPMRFVGADGNWFDPANWSTGRVPGDGDSVVIDGDALVVIDPELDPRGGGATVPLEDTVGSFTELRLMGNARLETRAGTLLEFDTMIIQDSASFFSASSASKGKTFGGGGGCSGWSCGYNPSYVEVEEYSFGESIALYLGGATQASETGVGPGHYSFINAERVILNQTSLQINLIYDFEPQPGDEFVIVEASGSITGTFSNFADGDVVLSTDSVDLVINYNSNQIVLSAESTQN